MRDTDHKEGKLVNAVIILLPLLLIAFLYLKQSSEFPYYFIWDMDHTCTIDSMLVQEGKIPSNLSHPGFGMHFMQAFTVECAKKFKLLSSSSLSDLRESLAPLACVAEHTDFLRRHSPFLCIGILLFLWLSLEKWFRPPLLFSLLSFCVLASQESLYFQSSMIRTELYSVFYWSASVLALTYAVQARRAGMRLLLFFTTGILIGLSFMTKLQALFFIAFTGVLFLSMTFLRENETGIPFKSLSNRHKQLLSLSTFVPFFVFCFLAVHSLSVVAPAGTEIFGGSGFGITPTMVAVAAAFLFIPLIQMYLVQYQKTDTVPYALSVYAAFIMWGFLLSFALHFAMFNDVAGSWRHLGLTFKVLFLRKTFAEFPGPETLVSRVVYYLGWHPALVLSHLGLLAAIGWTSLRSKFIPKKVFLVCLVFSALAILNNMFSIRRAFLRDLLWAEMLYTLLTLIYLALLVQYCGWARKWIKIPAIAIMSLILVFNARHMQLMPARLNALYPLYGWSPLRHMEGHYGALEAYTRFMKERLGAKPSLAVLTAEGRIATHHEEIRNMASFVFPNQDITLRQIGVVEKGLPVWLNALDYRIEAYPLEFESAIVVDSRTPMNPTGLLKADIVTTVPETGTSSDRMMPPVSDPPLAVLPRADLRVYIFCENRGDLYKAVSSYAYPKTEEPPKIVLSKGDEKLVMYGRLIPAYETIPYHTLAGRYFFLIYAPFYL